MAEWQPISEYDRDAAKRVLIGFFHLPGQDHMEVAFWNSRRKHWVGGGTTWKDQATHFMPLPEPAKAVNDPLGQQA